MVAQVDAFCTALYKQYANFFRKIAIIAYTASPGVEVPVNVQTIGLELNWDVSNCNTHRVIATFINKHCIPVAS